MTRKLPADIPSPELRGGIRPDMVRAPRKGLTHDQWLKTVAEHISETDPLLVGDLNATPNEFQGLKRKKLSAFKRDEGDSL